MTLPTNIDSGLVNAIAGAEVTQYPSEIKVNVVIYTPQNTPEVKVFASEADARAEFEALLSRHPHENAGDRRLVWCDDDALIQLVTTPLIKADVDDALQNAYLNIRESFELAMRWEFQRDNDAVDRVLVTVDDAVSNNFDSLTDHLPTCILTDENIDTEDDCTTHDHEYACLDCQAEFNSADEMDGHINSEHREGYGDPNGR